MLDDGLKASELYAIPDVVYGVNVVDASGLIEYRSPQILIANDLVKKLHSLGQIVPNVGDYVAIFDDEMGLKDVAGLITTITRRIDDPFQNALTIDTSFTDADELVGQIITATNTILNNKDIYGRANIISSKGELQTGTVTDALSTGKNSLSITSTNGKVVVDDNGLTATNPEDDQKLMRYNGTGILGSSNGGITWRNLMTQDGINANYIDAGTINTTKVSISDGQYATVFLDGNGLVVKQNGGQNYSVGTINPNTLEPIGFNNVKVYIGKDANMNGIGYFDGYINANSGGNIAGWKLSTNKLVAPNNTTYLSSNGDYAFYTEQDGKYAGIKHDGSIIGNNVNITGGSLTIGDNFKVTNNGNLTASNASVNGTITTNNITATGGKIGGWKIEDTTLSSNNIILNSAGSLSGGTSYHWSINKKGQAVFNYLTATSGGTIGNFTINSNKLSGGAIQCGRTSIGYTLKANSNGAEMTSNVGFIEIGEYTNHPWLSALNVSTRNGGIIFRDGPSISNAGSNKGSLNINDGYIESDIGYSSKRIKAGILHSNGTWLNYDNGPLMIGRAAHSGQTGQFKDGSGKWIAVFNGIIVGQSNSHAWSDYTKWD